MNSIVSQIKKYATFGVVALAAAMYTGCTDLDENPYTFISPDAFYNSSSDINAALNNTYRAFRNMAGNARNVVARLEVATDLGYECMERCKQRKLYFQQSLVKCVRCHQ